MPVKYKHTPPPWIAKETFVYAESPTSPDARHYGGELIAESIFSEHNRALSVAAPLLLRACFEALWEDSGLACAPQLREALAAAGVDPEE